MKIKVEVTQEDIDKGKRGKCNECPVANALARILDCFPVIGRFDIVLDDYNFNLCRCDMPIAVKNFVRNFDENLPVSPFTFDLEIPDSLAHLLRTDATQSDSQRGRGNE